MNRSKFNFGLTLGIVKIVALYCFWNSSLFAQSETSTAAPQIKTFALNPNNLGAIVNSVNLFTGDINLPGIPSNTEVEQNGVSVGEMQAKLLQKIEEMTLYVLDLNKRNEQQQKQIEQLQASLTHLLEYKAK